MPCLSAWRIGVSSRTKVVPRRDLPEEIVQQQAQGRLVIPDAHSRKERQIQSHGMAHQIARRLTRPRRRLSSAMGKLVENREAMVPTPADQTYRRHNREG